MRRHGHGAGTPGDEASILRVGKNGVLERVVVALSLEAPLHVQVSGPLSAGADKEPKTVSG